MANLLGQPPLLMSRRSEAPHDDVEMVDQSIKYLPSRASGWSFEMSMQRMCTAPSEGQTHSLSNHLQVSMLEFESLRTKEKNDRIYKVMSVAIILTWICYVCEIVMQSQIISKQLAKWIVELLQEGGRMLVLLIITSCPLRELDLDDFFERFKITRVLFFFSQGLYHVYMVYIYMVEYESLSQSLWELPAAIAAFGAGLGAKPCNIRVLGVAAFWCLFYCLEPIAYAAIQFQNTQKWTPTSIFWLLTFVARACVSCVYSILRFRRKQNPTLTLHFLMYVESAANTLLYMSWLVSGEFADKKRGQWYYYCRGVITFVKAFLWSMLILCVAIIGKAEMFRVLVRRIEQEPGWAERDGAFIAELFDSSSVRLGQTWWVQHGKNLSAFDLFDHRRNWSRGRVIHVDEKEFTVQVRESGEQEKVALPDRGMSLNGLIQLAESELRCIDWKNISKPLMTGAICGSNADISNAYALSRKVQPGEKIDFFMSHSWHDNAEDKWDKLQHFVDIFIDKEKRFPTFWLDKVCINQERIGDGLKVLPVCVMACRQMLVLCGHTYPQRLWCAWELCTLCAFRSQEDVSDRVRIVSLKGAPGDIDTDTFQGLNALENFDIKHAHCYDPNEERRLLNVIRVVGIRRFSSLIRTLACRLKAKEEREDSLLFRKFKQSRHPHQHGVAGTGF